VGTATRIISRRRFIFSAAVSICTRGQFEHVTHRVSGRTKCNKFEIYNVDLWRNDLLHRYGKETISIKKYNFLSYFLFEKFKKLFFKSSRKYDTDLCSSILITPEMKYRIKKK
jgi:hypothetical protein